MGQNLSFRKQTRALNQISKEFGDKLEQLNQVGQQVNFEAEARALENKVAHVSDHPGKIYEWAAWASICSLIAGLIAIATFAILNQERLFATG